MTIHLSETDIATCVAVLKSASRLDLSDPTLETIEHAVSAFYRGQKNKRKRLHRQQRSAHNRQTIHTANTANGTGVIGQLIGERACYACKTPYSDVTGQFPQLCVSCAHEHNRQRNIRANLSGRYAFITGGRTKLGYTVALKLLRDGANVLVTTRFPTDALQRYSAESDYSVWKNRLRIEPLDLRDLRTVIAWADRLPTTQPSLDIVIQCAAQTVSRPEQDYAALYEQEKQAQNLMATAKQSTLDLVNTNTTLSRRISPVDGLPEDLRVVHTWKQSLDQLQPVELIESLTINTLAPLLLTTRLIPWMKQSTFPDRYVVYVTSVEGQFSHSNKPSFHPHTNMSKAALNMLTRTSAQLLSQSGVYMASVDPGWFSDESPFLWKQAHERDGFVPPVKLEDAASRVYHPIASGVNGQPLWGCLLKDYREVSW